jgi:hypothetical protein
MGMRCELGGAAMNFFQTYGKEIVSLFVPLFAWLLNTFFKARAKLQLAKPHSFTFLVQQPLIDSNGKTLSPTQSVHTSSFVLLNAGKETATKIELVFNWQPECINTWPSRHYESRTEPDSRFTMLFDSLSPKESLGFELFSINRDLPDLVTARCDQCVAQSVTMYPQPVAKPWQRRIAVFLLFAGLFVFVYVVIVVLQFLILKTPYGH